jgi:hypothetical protein
VELANTEAEALCVQIEKLAAKAHDALFEPTLAAYVSRWQALPPNFDPAISARGHQAIERCREVIAAHARELARAAAERAAERAAEDARARAMEAELQAQQQAAAEQAEADASAQAAATKRALQRPRPRHRR